MKTPARNWEKGRLTRIPFPRASVPPWCIRCLQRFTFGLFILVEFSVINPTAAAAPAATADTIYEREIAPIFRAYCAGCHNDRTLEGGLSLETFARLRKGGEDQGDPVLPGDADGSFLIQSIEGRARPVMPPRDEPRVPAAELATLKRWIAAGARGPTTDTSILRTLVTPDLPAFSGPHPFTAAAYAPDGRLLVLARAGVIEVRDPELLTVLREIRNLPGKINGLRFSPDGRRLVAATGVTGLRGAAHVYDVASGDLLREFGEHTDILYAAAFSPDGQRLATAGYDHLIRVWRAADGVLLWANDIHKGAVFDLAWDPTGNVLASASADQTVKLWRATDGARLDTLNQPQGEMLKVVFTIDGQHVVAAGADRRIHVWRLVTRDTPGLNPMIHSRFAHESAICGLALSHDGRHLMSSATDRTVKLWSLPDLELRHAYDRQPDTAPVVTGIPGSGGFLVARLDGSMTTLPVRDTVTSTPPLAPVRSTPAEIADGALHEVREEEPDDDPTMAQRVTLPAAIQGSISKPGDTDLFRFAAAAGQSLWIEVDASRSGSRLDSRIEVLHADGRPVEQVVLQAVRDSWFTFRGKDSETPDDFRLHNWAQMELDEYLYANGEVTRLWLYPRGPDSGFKVYPGEGRRHTYFGTTPIVHALGAPAYIVNPLPAGSIPAPNGLPLFRLNYVNDDDPSRRFGSDSVLSFTAPTDGNYLVRVTDVRGFGGATEYTYTLTVRPPRPGFEVTLGGTNPKISPGSGREVTLRALRFEGFDGPIRVDIAGLPTGFESSFPVEIEAGQVAAVGVIYAESNAPDPGEAAGQGVSLAATATVAGRKVVRELGNLGTIRLGAAPKVTAEILPGADLTNVRINPGRPLEFEIRPGQTIAARVRAVRHDFDGRIEFGNEDSGRNLPYGVYVDNIGLNGLLIVEGRTERDFVITAAPIARPGLRRFHLRARADDGQASRPALIRVLPAEILAAGRSAVR